MPRFKPTNVYLSLPYTTLQIQYPANFVKLTLQFKLAPYVTTSAAFTNFKQAWTREGIDSQIYKMRIYEFPLLKKKSKFKYPLKET